jgi:hypothetical protein
MSAKMALYGLIVITAAALAILCGMAGEITTAVLAVAGGAAWLALETRRIPNAAHAFLLGVVALAALASLRDLPMLLILAALACGLAAWDLSAFVARTASVTDDAARAALERNHLRKLGITAAAGLGAALIPVVAQVSISFVALCLLLLAAVITLRVAVGGLRRRRDEVE